MYKIILGQHNFPTVKTGSKHYVSVKERIKYLAETFQGNYSIQTEFQHLESQRMWIVKATLTLYGPDGQQMVYTGHAQEVESDNDKKVNFTSALENCETSAVGRACAMAGIGIDQSIASAEELEKAMNRKEARHAESKTQPAAEQPKQQPAATATKPMKGFNPDIPMAFKKRFAGGTPGQVQMLYDILLHPVFTDLDIQEAEDMFAAGRRTRSSISDVIDKYMTELKKRKAGEPAKIKQKTELLLLLNSEHIEKDEKMRMIQNINTMTVSRIEQAISNLKATIAQRSNKLQTA